MSAPAHAHAPLAPAGAPPGGYREVLRLAYPLVITMASISVMGVVDALLMGYQGTAQQGAVGLAAILVFSMLSFFNGTITVVNTFVAQAHGAGDAATCGRVVWQGFYFGAMSVAVVELVVVPSTGDLVALMGAEPDVTEFARAYMDIRLHGAPFVFVTFAVVSYLRGLGDMRTPMWVTAGAVLANIPVSWVLVVGAFGLPALGIRGAALGTVLVQAVEAGVYLALFLSRRHDARHATRRFPGPDWRLMGRFLRVGLPIGVWWLIEMGGWTVFTIFVAGMGKVALAAHNIVLMVIHLSFMPGAALSITAQTLVGQYLGAGDPAAAERSARSALVSAMIFMGSMGLLLLLLRTPIARAFNPDPAVVEVAATLFGLAAIFQVFDGLGMVSGGAVRGAGDTRWPMAASLVTVWVLFVPGVYVFGRVLGHGVVGAWAGATGFVIVLGLVMYRRFRGGRWKTMRVVEADPRPAPASDGPGL